MRFISHIRKFGVGILTRRVEYLPGGVEREIQPMLVADFHLGDVTAAELEFAERHFDVHGRTFEQDEVTPTPLLGRLSTYDTESPANLAAYDQIDLAMEGQYLPGGREIWKRGSTKAYVEQKLIRKAGTSDDFALVVEEPVAPPWPKFDQFPGTAEDLVEVLVIQGHNLTQALAYERQNQSRLEVVQLLEEKVSEVSQETGVPAEFVSS